MVTLIGFIVGQTKNIRRGYLLLSAIYKKQLAINVPRTRRS